MRYVLAGLLIAGTVSVAHAQEVPQITVRPLDDGGGQAYVGPYGRELPGVSMFAGRAVPTPDIATGGVPIPSLQKIPNEYTYGNTPLPILDGWHGTLGGGIPF